MEAFGCSRDFWTLTETFKAVKVLRDTKLAWKAIWKAPRRREEGWEVGKGLGGLDAGV